MRKLKKILPKFDDDTLKVFKKFLKKNGAYDSYLRNFMQYFGCITDKEGLIIKAFSWRRTKEGYSFWDKLHRGWNHYSKIWCNNYTVFYRENDANFEPIIFTESNVKSNDTWNISKFYQDVSAIFDSLIDVGEEIYIVRYVAVIKSSTVQWGCREFTHKEIRQLKKALEEEYGKDLLR